MQDTNLELPPYRSEDPAIRTTSIVCGLVGSTDLDATENFYRDMLGLECVRISDGRMLARDGAGIAGPRRRQLGWILDVRQHVSIEHPQRVLHHWGIDLVSKNAVDDMNRRLRSHQAKYRIQQVFEPQFQHGSYAFYLQDFDSNWWEFQFVPPSRKATKFLIGDIVPVELINGSKE